jgi:hypothetical protein
MTRGKALVAGTLAVEREKYAKFAHGIQNARLSQMFTLLGNLEK